jgi:hypothetical protein
LFSQPIRDSKEIAMRYTPKKSRLGFTLIELALAAAIGVIITLILGVLLYAGHRNWAGTLNRSNRGIEVDALGTMLTFGAFGRQANRQDYAVYTMGNGSFLRAKPAAVGDVVIGQAVEFRYWAGPLNAAIMDTSITATDYMLFYLDGTTLKVDRGAYPPGGVANNGTVRLGGGTTQVLAENVTALQFSHTTRNINGDGNGCVRLDMTLQDPADSRTITVKTATLLRNDWGITPTHN